MKAEKVKKVKIAEDLKCRITLFKKKYYCHLYKNNKFISLDIKTLNKLQKKLPEIQVQMKDNKSKKDNNTDSTASSSDYETSE